MQDTKFRLQKIVAKKALRIIKYNYPQSAHINVLDIGVCLRRHSILHGLQVAHQFE